MEQHSPQSLLVSDKESVQLSHQPLCLLHSIVRPLVLVLQSFHLHAEMDNEPSCKRCITYYTLWQEIRHALLVTLKVAAPATAVMYHGI